jgi:hypothetical protein
MRRPILRGACSLTHSDPFALNVDSGLNLVIYYISPRLGHREGGTGRASGKRCATLKLPDWVRVATPRDLAKIMAHTTPNLLLLFRKRVFVPGTDFVGEFAQPVAPADHRLYLSGRHERANSVQVLFVRSR